MKNLVKQNQMANVAKQRKYKIADNNNETNCGEDE